MSISIVLAGSVVVVLANRFMRCQFSSQFFKPTFVVVQETCLIVIYEYSRSYMHGIQ